MKWTHVKYPKWEVVLDGPDRANMPCLIHDTCLSQYNVRMTIS